jgi:hypothetical protein
VARAVAGQPRGIGWIGRVAEIQRLENVNRVVFDLAIGGQAGVRKATLVSTGSTQGLLKRKRAKLGPGTAHAGTGKLSGLGPATSSTLVKICSP